MSRILIDGSGDLERATGNFIRDFGGQLIVMVGEQLGM